jgi:hypothetical protein
MITPQATLKLMREGFWGARAMERRVIECCADNPACPFHDECRTRYDIFVNATDVPVKTELARKNDIEVKKRNYRKLRKAGVGAKVAARNLTNRRTEQLLKGARHG